MTHRPISATEVNHNQMSDFPDEILTIDEVATYLKTSKRTVYRLAASGKLPAFKLGGTWRFRKEDLTQWITTRVSKTTTADDEESK